MAAKTYDSTINAKVQGQGPDDMVIAGTLNIDSSAGGICYVNEVDITACLAALKAQPTTATFSPAAGGSNISLVTITVKDADGTAVTGPVVLDVLLSDASSGAGLTATEASGAVAAGASGVDLATLVSKKALRVQTTAAGVYILSITDTAKTGFYVVAQLPGRKAVVSSALVTGNYG